MSEPDLNLSECASAAAEEVLRLIFGDDLQGCAIGLDSVAAAILEPFQALMVEDREFLALYAKAFEAVELLAKPPPPSDALTPEGLRSLLGERLDAIRTLTSKVRHAAMMRDRTVEAD